MIIQWEKPKSTNGRGERAPYARVTLAKSGKQKKSLVITLSEEAMKAMRWLAGDRAAIGFDGSHIYVRRANDGYTLSPAGAPAGPNREKKYGTPCRVTISMTEPSWAKELALPINITKEEVFDKDGMLVFKGRQNASKPKTDA